MQPNIGVSVKSLPLPLRKAAEEFLGRPIEDDEMLAMYTYRDSEPQRELSQEEWERELDDFIDLFPQTPLLSGEAISRESIYTREDEML